MTTQTPTPWTTLNTSYYTASLGDPLSLLDDASMLLNGAQSISRMLCDALPTTESLDRDDLANAMWCVATLIDMGQGSTREAMRRWPRGGEDAGAGIKAD
ncbi:hypothetical protein [Dyella acidiphila]|uniref:Uncharacterized protein n=1 Tax=Dyella acidiphila TaxID=2775866 RepID=A0ABR9G9T4_9GAMM|nr:hypothetical protein [Dyella acidiphila]MBE1160810.1 hypothetical protein [Dyella acidiphila]